MEQVAARYPEEDAFSENATGLVCGFGWPPRSYFCNFCDREFGSAQALGGHMNVHRRDRARLKQSPGFENDHHQHQNSRKIVGSDCFYKLVCNPDSLTTSRAFLLPISDSRISATPENVVSDHHGNKENAGRKRWRNNDEPSLSSFPSILEKIPKSTSMKKEIKKLLPDGNKDLDLELRLGFSIF